MKRLLTVTLLILCLLTSGGFDSFAQKNKKKRKPRINLTISRQQDKSFGKNFAGIIFDNKEGCYIVRTKLKGFYGVFASNPREEITLDFYDTRLSYRKSFPLEGLFMESGYGKTKNSLEFFVQDSSEDMYVFHTKADKASDNEVLYKTKLDKKTFSQLESEQMYETEYRKTFGSRQSTYSCLISPDSSLYAIVSIVGRKIKQESSLYVHVMDQDLNSLWSNEFELPGRTSEIFIQDLGRFLSESLKPQMKIHNKDYSISMDNQGNVNLLVSYKEKGSKSYDFHLFSASEGKQLIDNHIKLPEIYPNEIMITYNDLGKALLYGFASKNMNRYNVDYLLKIPYDNLKIDLKEVKITEFSKDHKAAILTSCSFKDRSSKRKLDKGKDVKLGNMDIKGIVSYSNGEYTILAEPHRIIKHQENGTIELKHYHGGISFLHMSSDGEIKWIKEVEKYQNYSHVVEHSFIHFKSDDRIYFAYNDLKKNELRGGTIDKEGNMHAITIARRGEYGQFGKSYLKIKEPIKLSEKEYLSTIFSSKNHTRLVKFTLK